MHFALNQNGPGQWAWCLRDTAGGEIARSSVAYPSEVQASAAAMAFAQMVAQAGRQIRQR